MSDATTVNKSTAFRKNLPNRPNSGAPQELKLRAVLDAFRSWWRIVVPLGIVLGIVGGGLAFIMTRPSYEAVAWIQIDQKPTSLSAESGYETRSQEFIQTQLELLHSPLVLSKVLRDPQVLKALPPSAKTDSVAALSKALTVKPMGQSELYRVSVITGDRKEAAVLTNAVLDTYFQVKGDEQNGRLSQMIASLEAERQQRANEVAAMRESLEVLTRKVANTGSSASGTENSDWTDLQKQLRQAEVDREVLQAKIKSAEHAATSTDPIALKAAADKAVEEDPEIKKLKQAVVAQKTRLDEIERLAAAGKNDPIYRKSQEELANLEQTVKQHWEARRQHVLTELATAEQAKAAQELAVIRRDLATQISLEQALRRRTDVQVQMPNSEAIAELEAKRSDLTRAEKFLDVLAGRIAKFRTEQRAPQQVTLLHRADVPTGPLETFPLKQVAGAMLAGLGLPFLLALGWERSVRRVSRPETLSEQSNLAVLGEVSRMPMRIGSESAFYSSAKWQSFEESIDSLRTTLMLSDGAESRRVLAVTSAVTGEGKTNIASRLAVSIGRATGQRTLLIDGDMRSPRIHEMYRIGQKSGLSDLLAGKIRVEDAIIKIDHMPVDVIPAGLLRGNPHELLGTGGAFKQILDQLRQYEHIVIDTPPVLTAGEALVMTRAADGCLICTMQHKSHIDLMEKARQRLEETGAHVLGVVHSGVSTSVYAYRGNRYAELSA